MVYISNFAFLVTLIKEITSPWSIMCSRQQNNDRISSSCHRLLFFLIFRLYFHWSYSSLIFFEKKICLQLRLFTSVLNFDCPLSIFCLIKNERFWSCALLNKSLGWMPFHFQDFLIKHLTKTLEWIFHLGQLSNSVQKINYLTWK